VQAVQGIPTFFGSVTLVGAETHELRDLIVTLAERVARRLSDAALRILQPPIDVPGFDVSMAWNPITEHDPAIDWMKQEIRKDPGLG
jgi:hypothetical protein